MDNITKTNILNYIFPIVTETVHMINLSQGEVKYIIKGGASIKYHLNGLGINTDGLTYDIDMAPIFFYDGNEELYLTKALEFNEKMCQALMETLEGRVTRDGGNIKFMNNKYNNLISISVSINNSEYIEMIDISYIDPIDGASTFMKSVEKIRRNYNFFAKHFHKMYSENISSMFSTPQLEMCVALYGLSTSIKHRDSREKWIQDFRSYTKRLIELQEKLAQLEDQHIETEGDILELQIYSNKISEEIIELFGEDDGDDAATLRNNFKMAELGNKLIDIIEEINKTKSEIIVATMMKDNREKIISDQYLAKIEDKISRYNTKITLLQRHFGTKAEFC